MTAFFEHQKTSYKQDYLRNLIFIASDDGQLGDSERLAIYRIGKERGLKLHQIDELVKDEVRLEAFFVPESSSNRMELLFDVMQIIYADGTVNNKEIGFIRSLVDLLHMRAETTDHLIDFFQFGTPKKEDWEDFAAHLSRVFSR